MGDVAGCKVSTSAVDIERLVVVVVLPVDNDDGEVVSGLLSSVGNIQS